MNNTPKDNRSPWDCLFRAEIQPPTPPKDNRSQWKRLFRGFNKEIQPPTPQKVIVPGYVPPSIAAVSCAGINLGLTTMITHVPVSASVYARNGLAGGLFGLGIYSGMRSFYQEEDLSHASCLASCGLALSFGSALNVEFDMKQNQNFKPQPLSLDVISRGLFRGFFAVSVYGAVKSLFLSGDYGAHHD